jgi:hypothetical protein
VVSFVSTLPRHRSATLDAALSSAWVIVRERPSLATASQSANRTIEGSIAGCLCASVWRPAWTRGRADAASQKEENAFTRQSSPVERCERCDVTAPSPAEEDVEHVSPRVGADGPPPTAAR